jgi:hypothetical protein
MTTHTALHRDVHGSELAGTVTLALGVLFTAAVAFAYVLSLRESFNPPDWVRVLGLVWLPIGLGGVPVGYAVARTGAGREHALVGVLVALTGLVALVGLVVAVG